MTKPVPKASPTVTDEVKAHLDQRLMSLGQTRPDLEAALALQRSLLTQQVDLLGVLMAGGLPSLSMPPRYLVAKLGRGIPILHAEPIPLPSQLLTLAVRDFCDRLRSGATTELAATIQQRFDDGRLVPATVLSACFGRDQQRTRLLAAHAEASADLLWLIAELALAPFAHLLQVHILARGGQAVEDAVAAWDQGFCPACGSWPALIESSDAHVLRCSFCALGWQLRAYRCVYCRHEGEGFITAALNPDDPSRRLQLCEECGGYVKVIRTDRATMFPLVAVEDLASLDLDMAAIERNYVRPALPQIRKTAAPQP
jgi:FdhE protein